MRVAAVETPLPRPRRVCVKFIPEEAQEAEAACAALRSEPELTPVEASRQRAAVRRERCVQHPGATLVLSMLGRRDTRDAAAVGDDAKPAEVSAAVELAAAHRTHRHLAAEALPHREAAPANVVRAGEWTLGRGPTRCCLVFAITCRPIG
jgi:hypothetical protein